MKKHMKRLPAPRTWKIERKAHTWAMKPSAGPHPIERSIPLGVVLRDYLNCCDNTREAKAILNSSDVFVDERVVTKVKFPVGLMDVLRFKETKEQFRMLLDNKGKLTLVRISDAEAKWKLVRIENKHTVPGGQIQLNLHDGRNILIKKNKYSTRTTLKIKLPDQEIIDSFALEDGNTVLLIGGRHAGEVVHVSKLELTRNPRANLVHFDEGFSTVIAHAFVVGNKNPEITLPEGVAL